MELIYEQIIRLVVASVLGSLVGTEREKSHKPAGLRTHMLVCLGSALLTLFAIDYFGEESARIIQGIVTGMGFIGAGTIIAQGERGIHGLTTAASVWVVSAIGVGVGIGWYALSTIAAVLTLVILLLGRFEKKSTE